MSNQTVSAKKSCGQCTHWKETKAQCPGWGFCGHSQASRHYVDSGVLLLAKFLPAASGCLLSH